MENNKLLSKVQELLDERNWSLYKLAKESEIPYSSLNSLFAKDNVPTVATLEKICNGFHITLAEFFEEESPYRCETPIITKYFIPQSYSSPSKNCSALILLIPS